MSHSMKSAVIPHTNQNLMLKDKFRSVKLSTALGLFASPQLFPPHLASGRYLSNSITSSFHIYNNNNNFQRKYLMEPITCYKREVWMTSY